MKAIILSFLLICLYSSCSDNISDSPNPGTLEVRLRTEKGNFTYNDEFLLRIQSLKILRADGAYADIFDNLHAIRDNVDIYNILKDTILVIGESYLPSDNFIKLLISIEPPDSLIYYGRKIKVEKDEPFDALVSLNIAKKIKSNERTVITIITKADSLLYRNIDHFIYKHHYSIQQTVNQ